MFAALKKFFSRGVTTSETAPVPPPQTSAPSHRPIASTSRTASPQVAPPQMRPAAPAPPPVAAPAFAAGGGATSIPTASAGEMISLPLLEVIKGLPDLIRAGVVCQPAVDTLISLPLALILPQVAAGTVKLPFGQLRIACPAGIFPASTAHDQTVVTLPLALILPQINAAYLARRSGQRRTVDPKSFEAVFTPMGAQETPAAAPSAHMPGVQPHVANPFTPIAPPTPASIPMSTHLPFAKAAPLPKTGLSPLREPESSAPATRLPGTLPRPAAKTPPSTQTALTERLWIPLHLLSTHLPPNVQMILANPAFAMGKIGIPVSELEAGLKHGKLVFSWKQLCNWIEPAVPAGGMAEDELVSLPLPILVPLFLAKHSAGMAGSQKRVVLDHSIPDVFSAASSGKSAVMAAPVQPLAVKPLVSETPTSLPDALVATPLTLQPEVSGAQEMGVLFGQSDKTSWTPVEIVGKTAGLPGMVGSLISLQDGLLVAGKAPDGINAETIAAFIPQVFGRMAHYTRELKFGEPSYVGLVLAEYSLHIFKTGDVYFLAMGRAGVQAPLAQLSVIAAQLDRQSKSN
jgi:predicted regulator of Ras-like GTPase activity (Roadblock/LC7/MglB family)